MQTSRSQTQPPRKEISDFSFPSDRSSSKPKQDNKFRFRLSLAVFYPYALFLTLFAGLLYKHGAATGGFVVRAVAVLAVTVAFLIYSYFLISSVLRERRLQQKRLSRADRLVAITDILSEFQLPIREKMKRVGRQLAEEGDLAGWRCRIVLQDESSFLPPAGPNLGFHFPMTAGEKNVGTLIVTANASLGVVDERFFDGLARLLGPFLYKEKQWNDFHAEVDRLQASLLLNAVTAPDFQPPTEQLTVEHMLRTLGLLQGKVENSVDNKL